MQNFFISILDPILKGDKIDKMIADRDINSLNAIIIDGLYNKANIKSRIYPPSSRDLALHLANLNVVFFVLKIILKKF